MKIKLLFFLLSPLIIFGQAAHKNVTDEEFKKLMQDSKAIIIDLRTPHEIAGKGKIEKALEIDFLSTDAETKIKSLDKKKTYLVYCAGGGRSADCMELMQKEGFPQVYNLQKGFDDWQKKGNPVLKTNN